MEFLKKNWKNILLLVCFFVIIALLMSTTCTKQKLDIAENNLKAMNDTVKTYKLKNGELMYERQGFILTIDDLEKYVSIQKSEIKELKKKLDADIAVIGKLQEQIKMDSIVMHDSVYIDQDSVIHNHFDYNDRWFTLDGDYTLQLNPFKSRTIINCINMEVPLKVGMAENNKWFAVTENPYVSFTNIEGVNLSAAKPKRFSIGFQLGVGLLGGYGICGSPDGVIRYGWIIGGGFYAGVGLTYKFIEF